LDNKVFDIIDALCNHEANSQHSDYYFVTIVTSPDILSVWIFHLIIVKMGRWNVQNFV